MDDVNRFLNSSRSTIKQSRRDRLKSPLSSFKALFTCLILIVGIIALIAGINHFRNKPNTVVKIEMLNIAYSEADNDWGFFLPRIGHMYQVPSDQVSLWSKFVADPATHDRLVKKIAATRPGTLSNSKIDERLKESTVSGALNLIN